MLSAAKHLTAGAGYVREILRCAQDDNEGLRMTRGALRMTRGALRMTRGAATQPILRLAASASAATSYGSRAKAAGWSAS